MKVDAKEIIKIYDALEKIDGWEVVDVKMWDKKSGTGMSTIRLMEKKEEKKEETPSNGNGGGASIDINIKAKEPKEEGEYDKWLEE